MSRYNLRKFRLPALALLVGLLVRALMDYLLVVQGYYYGQSWQTFWRSLIAWRWAQQPSFFVPGGEVGMPLQLWLAGLAYKLQFLFDRASNLSTPVLLNHLFFLGSLAVTFYVARKLGGFIAAWVAVLLAATQAGDIWATFSGLSEPLFTFLVLMVSALLFTWAEAPPQARGRLALLASFFAMLATATHINGWFLALVLSIWFSVYIFYRPLFRSQTEPEASAEPVRYNNSPYWIALGLVWLFPLVWVVVNSVAFGDALHFLSGSAPFQADLAAGQSLSNRISMQLAQVWRAAPGIVLAALVALPALLYKKAPERAVYLLPGLMLLVAALSVETLAPGTLPSGPASKVIYVWLLIPFVAAWLARYLRTPGLERMLAYGGFTLLLVVGLIHSVSFTNIFGEPVQQTGAAAGTWLEQQSETQKILIESQGFTEAVVIPVTAGWPDRFIQLDTQAFISLASDQQASAFAATSPENAPLWILSSEETYQALENLVAIQEVIKPYRLVTP